MTAAMAVSILHVDAERDAGALSELYNHYILNTPATFEEKPISPADAAGRVRAVYEAGFPWLIAQEGPNQALLGYAYAAPWKPRPAYRYCCEVSIYIAPGSEGRGVGSALYAELIPQLAEQGMHTALAGITLPNPSSIALHEKFGFHKVAQLEQVGFKFGSWIDVGYWERIFST